MATLNAFSEEGAVAYDYRIFDLFNEVTLVQSKER
jgi:hypothetical protein